MSTTVDGADGLGNSRAMERSARQDASPDLAPEAADAERHRRLEAVATRYAVAVTPAVGEIIDDDPLGPVARQYLPDIAELSVAPYETADPIADRPHSPVPGVVHRYPDRVLFKVVAHCAVYCRFCFRREMVGPGKATPLGEDDIAAALAYIAAHPAIWEVILSGGDPMILSARRIEALTRALCAIPHVRTLRWHTRIPVVAPERVTTDVTQALRAGRRAAWVAIHVNHADELTPSAAAAISRLVDAGIPVVSQTVLLAGLNDDPDTLEDLMRALVELRVKPYYLHHLDPAPGTSHWRTSLARGQDITRHLRGRLSGLAQPTYVIDLPGGAGKVPASSPHLLAQAGSATYCGCDAFGRPFTYSDPAERA